MMTLEAQDIILSILMSAINYIIVNSIASASQQRTISDVKQVLSFMLDQQKQDHSQAMSQIKEAQTELMSQIKESKK